MAVPHNAYQQRVLFLKAIAFCLALTPLSFYVYQFIYASLANPVEYVTRATGDWALRFLLLTLAITPLRKLTGWRELLKFRRMLGLFAFFYVCVHFAIYAILDVVLNNDLTLSAVIAYLVEDIIKRPYITVGFVAFLLLIPLAVTSTRAMIKRLGRNWQKLHRLVYLIAVLAVIHYWWLVKKDLREPIIYSLILALLLLLRIDWRGLRLRRLQKELN